MKDKQVTQEATIDIKALILKYTRYWYYFVLSILFFSFIAFLNNRYTIPEYRVYTTIEIRDDNNTQVGAENLIEGLELFSGKNNLENEIVKLSSYSITEQVIKELGLGISYFQHGFFQTNELFKNSSFIVTLDSLHNQLTGVDFHINIINDRKFQLSITTKDQIPYNLITEKFDKTLLANIDINETYEFDKWIENDYFKFVVNKSSFFNLDRIKSSNKDYSFKLHQTNNLFYRLRKEIAINPINKEASILKLTIKGKTPKKNIAILDKLTAIYIRNGLSDKNLMANNTLNFIDEQLDVIQDSLTSSDNKIEHFRLQDLPKTGDNDNLGKQTLDNTLSEELVKIKSYKSLLSYLINNEDENNIVAPTSMGNPELQSLITPLLELYAEKRKLQQTTTERHPTYIAVLDQIDDTKETIIENIKNQIDFTAIYEKDLKSRINTLTSKINKLPEAEKKELTLLRKQEIVLAQYKSLQEKWIEVAIAKAGIVSDHQVIDDARLDSKTPIKPRKVLAYFIAILFGILLPIIFISLRDFFSDTITSKADLLKSTNIPILGLIGHSDNARSLVVSTSSKSIIAESFRSLRTNIQYLAAEKPRKIITVTSSVGGEGKTFTAINLATIFALSGHKTMLIGGDLRKPKLHEDFKVDATKGLSNLLINKSELSDVIEKTKIDTLDVIASGPTPPNPAELLDSTKMKDLITKLNKTYDYVIIDTPPIGLVTDGVILMQYSDVNLYVVRHNYSKTKALGIINNLYNQQQVKNVHIIINDFKQSSSGYGYGYGYGYGSSGDGYYETDDE